MLTIASGYDPLYLTRAVATGRENYYLSAVADHGEPPGVWTGLGCPELGLAVGSEVDNKVMERLYGAFHDPRDPKHKATLGRAPSGFTGNNDKVSERIAGLLAAEPEATPERRDQIIMQALKEQRSAVYFFDATFSVPKSVSLLHASLQVRNQQAREAGRDEEASQWGWSMAQFVTLDSRQAKAHSAPPREALLARWEAQSRRAETEALSAIPDTVFGVPEPGADAHPPSGADVDRILAAAVADAQRSRATFSRYELTRMINRYLPDHLGGLSGEQVTSLLDELTTQALRPGGPADAVLLTAPEMVPVPEAYRRGDGLSLWRRHGAEIYTTRAMLDTEARLLRAAAHNGAAKIAPERAAAMLGGDRARVEARLWREHGPGGLSRACRGLRCR